VLDVLAIDDEAVALLKRVAYRDRHGGPQTLVAVVEREVDSVGAAGVEADLRRPVVMVDQVGPAHADPDDLAVPARIRERADGPGDGGARGVVAARRQRLLDADARRLLAIGRRGR